LLDFTDTATRMTRREKDITRYFWILFPQILQSIESTSKQGFLGTTHKPPFTIEEMFSPKIILGFTSYLDGNMNVRRNLAGGLACLHHKVIRSNPIPVSVWIRCDCRYVTTVALRLTDNKNNLWMLQPMTNLGLCFTVSGSYRKSVGLLGRRISPSWNHYLNRRAKTQNRRI
jgi:hypothetical protein